MCTTSFSFRLECREEFQQDNISWHDYIYRRYLRDDDVQTPSISELWGRELKGLTEDEKVYWKAAHAVEAI